MSKHTAGHWEIVKDGATHIIKQKDGPLIAATYGLTGLDRKEEEAANARLIAAAPDLLSVLEELVADNQILSKNIRNAAILDRAEAVLALARLPKWTQEAFSAFLDGFSKAAGLSREDGEDQWAGYGCLLSNERRELLEAGGTESGLTEGTAFLQRQ